MKKILLILLCAFTLTACNQETNLVPETNESTEVSVKNFFNELNAEKEPTSEFLADLAEKYSFLNKEGEQPKIEFSYDSSQLKDPVPGTGCGGYGWYVALDDDCWCWLYRRYSTTQGVITFRFEDQEAAENYCNNR